MAVGQEVLVRNEANLCLTIFSTSIMQMNGSSALLQQHRALRMADMAAVMWSCLAIHFLPDFLENRPFRYRVQMIMDDDDKMWSADVMKWWDQPNGRISLTRESLMNRGRSDLLCWISTRFSSGSEHDDDYIINVWSVICFHGCMTCFHGRFFLLHSWMIRDGPQFQGELHVCHVWFHVTKARGWKSRWSVASMVRIARMAWANHIVSRLPSPPRKHPGTFWPSIGPSSLLGLRLCQQSACLGGCHLRKSQKDILLQGHAAMLWSAIGLRFQCHTVFSNLVLFWGVYCCPALNCSLHGVFPSQPSQPSQVTVAPYWIV